jgi:uncharacterized protein (DUF1810 family)
MVNHFLVAQSYILEQALQEIRSGKKTGRWILF